MRGMVIVVRRLLYVWIVCCMLMDRNVSYGGRMMIRKEGEREEV